MLVLPADHSFCREQDGDTVPRSVLSGALREVPFLLSCRDSSIRRLEELFTQLMFRPNVVCELNSNDIALRMVADGAGAALIPLGYARTAEGIRLFHLEAPLVREDVLAFRKGWSGPALWNFWPGGLRRMPVPFL